MDHESVDDYTFEPLARKHFDLLFHWLQMPHVKQWWGSETNREEFEQRYSAIISHPLVFPHIVSRNGVPIGYMNYWFVAEDPNFKPLFPSTTVGTDQFICVPELTGKGIGSQFIRIFTDQLLARPDIRLVITDPDPRNIAAIRAYEKAGFVRTRVMQTSEGLVQLMEKAR